ncbi:uncharacterized protein B0T15DRAFT_258077 [Chaetomium strumarium]|uniref:Uncharacterized protein n=1 Tax=Chaetomium strumarium TaxID=1170767 RepID=A0AAJ0GMW9_9PEZI|nr:hypothetical protein B0T15DRAFT_258077 [Chaetomium strumarium]
MATDETTPLLPTSQQRKVESENDAMNTVFWKIGAVYGAAGVALGAFGAHGLKKYIAEPQKLANWSTAAQYQLIHSVALLVARNSSVAATFFTAGMTMFSGSLYALTLDTERFRFLGPVTPLGGLCLIAGWLALAFRKPPVGLRWPRY